MKCWKSGHSRFQFSWNSSRLNYNGFIMSVKRLFHRIYFSSQCVFIRYECRQYRWFKERRFIATNFNFQDPYYPHWVHFGIMLYSQKNNTSKFLLILSVIWELYDNPDAVKKSSYKIILWTWTEDRKTCYGFMTS